MGDVAPHARMSATEYLAWERTQTDKHEYHLDEVFAMAGGSPQHNFLSGAMVAELRAALRGRGCHVLSSDQRISVAQGERYVYADGVVARGGVHLEAGTNDVLANPTVVVEVLSPSTESYDRGAKWELPSTPSTRAPSSSLPAEPELIGIRALEPRFSRRSAVAAASRARA